MIAGLQAHARSDRRHRGVDFRFQVSQSMFSLRQSWISVQRLIQGGSQLPLDAGFDGRPDGLDGINWDTVRRKSQELCPSEFLLLKTISSVVCTGALSHTTTSSAGSSGQCVTTSRSQAAQSSFL